MIQKEKLAQFYFAQYKACAQRLKKKNNDGKKTYEKRIDTLLHEMRGTRAVKISQAHLEEYHRQIRNLVYFAYKTNNQIAVMKIRDMMMPELVRLDLGGLTEAETELVTQKFLDFLRVEMPYDICLKTLKALCRSYGENGIRPQIIEMVPTRPETEFPEAMDMQRRFILHIGPTNCGKTYEALMRLKTAQHGVYLGPLRLLALEVYEKMKEFGLPCTMLTGEERIYEDGSRVTSSTVEMLDLDQ